VSPKVLVIEDDIYLLRLIAAAFERCGFEALSAFDGDMGMRIFNTEQPQLVVADIIMPGKEGIATIIELKGAVRPPKVIAISGGGRLPNNDCLRWAKCLGADEVMAKPFQMTALVAAGQALLGLMPA
jgi:DNA-binding response OmpR family regulator